MSRRTYLWNRFETTLASSMLSEADSCTLNSTTGLRAPGRLVIDDDDDQKAEYIEYTGIAGTTLTGVARGLAGSVNGAVDHDSGRVVRSVPIHQMYDDLFTDVEDLETEVGDVEQDLTDHETTGTHQLATPTNSGFMSASDKALINSFAAGTLPLAVLDNVGRMHRLRAGNVNTPANVPGMWLHPDTNPAAGDPLFGVASTLGGAKRFEVQHNAELVQVTPSGLLVAGNQVIKRGDNMENEVVLVRHFRQNVSQNIPTSNLNYLQGTLTIPAHWRTGGSSYRIEAVGWVGCVITGTGAANQPVARIIIAGNVGGDYAFGNYAQSDALGRTMMASNADVNLTASSPVVTLQLNRNVTGNTWDARAASLLVIARPTS